MTFLYSKDIKRRTSKNVLGTSSFVSSGKVEDLADIKKQMEDRMKYGYQYFVLDDESNKLIQQSIESARSRANLKNMQSELFKPITSALQTKQPELKSIEDIEKELGDKSKKKHNGMPGSEESSVPANAYSEHGSKHSSVSIPSLSSYGRGIKNVSSIKEMLSKIKSRGAGKGKHGCGIVEL